MRVLLAANVFVEILPELFGEREEHFVLVVYRLLQERDQLLAGTVGSKGKGNSGNAVNRVQSQLDIFRPELVHEDGDWSDLNDGSNSAELFFLRKL